MSHQDMLTTLPDDLIHSILSLLPFKSAITTSALSKQWKNLWKHSLAISTALDFTGDFYHKQSAQHFVDNINKYLQLHGDSNLESLSIQFTPFIRFVDEIESWINLAARKGVKKLKLDFVLWIKHDHDYFLEFPLPDCILYCTALTHLSLSSCDNFELSSFVNLRCLSLDYCCIDDDMFDTVMSCCVLLEELSLIECFKMEDVIVPQTAVRLRKLNFSKCYLHQIWIMAPALKSFYYYGDSSGLVQFRVFSGLDDLFIFLEYGQDCHYQYIFVNTTFNMWQLRVLSLCWRYLMYLFEFRVLYGNGQERLPIYTLRELQYWMGWSTREHLSCIYSFFELSPMPFLEKLFINLIWCRDSIIDTRKRIKANQEPPDIVFNHLKVIKIDNFRGSVNEMELVKFFLKKAVALESLFIVGQVEQSSIQDEISMLQKTHSKMQILYKNDDDNKFTPTHPPPPFEYEDNAQ